MEKRLPLFLFLSFAVLFGWQLLFPPPPKPVQEGGAQQAPALGATVAPSLPEIGAEVRQAEPWTEWIEFGQAGEPGHYRLLANSLGGSIDELRLDGWYDLGRLSEAERKEPLHWTELATPVEVEGQTRRSLQLLTAPSSGALFPAGLERVHWQHDVLLEQGRTVGLRFSHQPSAEALRVVKELRSVPGRLHLLLSISFEAPANWQGPTRAGFTLIPVSGLAAASEDRYYIEPKARRAFTQGGEVDLASAERRDRASAEERSGSLPAGGETKFVGLDNKYFAVLLRPAAATSPASLGASSWRRTRDEEWARGHPAEAEAAWRGVLLEQELSLQLPAGGSSTSFSYELYAGPKDHDSLVGDHAAHEILLSSDLGTFDGIGGLLLSLLGGLHGIFGNWGIAIIVLTLLVRGVLFPMNRKSQTAMARHATKMKRVQPKIDALKERYKDNPQKLRQEQARVMQEEGAFPPLSGCLPMFLQIPVFFGLYSALRVSFDLRQARFLWIEDLSLPDRLLKLDFNTHLPILGTIEYLNVLPPLMVVLWILQQRLMPKPTDEQAARMQKMMAWMPVLFGVFLYNYAAGLSLYMITSSLFGIAEYTVVRRIWPLDDKEKPKKKPGKFMQRLMELQEQQRRMQQQQQKAPQGKGR